MNKSESPNQSKDRLARRLLVGTTAAAGLFLLADARFDFVPGEDAPPSGMEIISGVGVIALALAGNRALKSFEVTD